MFDAHGRTTRRPYPAAPEDPRDEPVDGSVTHSTLSAHSMDPRLIGCRGTGHVLENKQRRAVRALAALCAALLAAVGRPCEDHSPGMHSSPAACYRCSTREASADSIRGTSSTQRWPFPTAAIFPRPTTFENAPPAVSWPTGACVELAVDSHLFTPSIERYVLQYAPALTG